MSRVPPSDLPTERLVLSAALLDADAAALAVDILPADDYYADAHARVWDAVVGLTKSGRPVDTNTVRGWMDDAGTLKAIGDDGLLALTDAIPMVAHVEGYCTRLRELATLRRVIAELHTQTAAAYGAASDVRAFLDTAESAIGRVTQSHTGGELLTMADVVEGVAEDMTAMGDRKSELLGHASGLRDLDKFLHGWCPGDLIVLAGRPSMGKTSIAMNVARGIATPHIGLGALPVVVFSCEMPAKQLAQRMLSSDSAVPLERIRSAKLNREQWADFTKSAGELAELPILFNPVTSADILTVRRLARKATRDRGKLGAVVIDYLQLMSTTPGRDSRDAKLGEITRGLKQLALEIECPVVLLSQLNRECEKRPDKRPMMADLRETGNLEQDADTILFVYRDEVYNTETDDRGIAEVLVRKQRNGPTGMVRLGFMGERTLFYDVEQHRDGEYGQ